MAAKTAKMFNDVDISGKIDRLLMNRLRDSGLEYVSSSGKIVPAKTQPEHFCHCPQKCKTKLSQEKWDELFERFYNLGDQNKQNQFLQSHIVIKTVHLHNWESDKTSQTHKRRVTCKYHVPHLSEDSDLEEYVTRRGNDSIEVCQKAFMNCYGITEKRVRMQREKCISKLAPDHYKHSALAKRQKAAQEKPELEMLLTMPKVRDFSNDSDIKPLDLSNDKGKRANCGQFENIHSASFNADDQNSEAKDQPLDLSVSNHTPTPSPPPTRCSLPPQLDISKSYLYEIAQKMGVSRETIDREMAQQYEKYLARTLNKSRNISLKNGKRHSVDETVLNNYKMELEIENRSPGVGVSSEETTEFEEDEELPSSTASVLPIQTLNNGDLTITPVVNSVSPKPVETMDIMRVNAFFQNQLWQPELIGLSSWRKLRSQYYDI